MKILDAKSGTLDIKQLRKLMLDTALSYPFDYDNCSAYEENRDFSQFLDDAAGQAWELEAQAIVDDSEEYSYIDELIGLDDYHTTKDIYSEITREFSNSTSVDEFIQYLEGEITAQENQDD